MFLSCCNDPFGSCRNLNCAGLSTGFTRDRQGNRVHELLFFFPNRREKYKNARIVQRKMNVIVIVCVQIVLGGRRWQPLGASLPLPPTRRTGGVPATALSTSNSKLSQISCQENDIALASLSSSDFAARAGRRADGGRSQRDPRAASGDPERSPGRRGGGSCLAPSDIF